MMLDMFRLSSLVLGVSLTCACSSSPPRDPATPQVISANQSGGASAPDLPSDSAASQTDVDKAMRKRGYQPALYRGERVYCRNEAITGSNLESKVCLTARQIEDLERSGQDMLNVPHPAGCMPKTGGPTCM